MSGYESDSSGADDTNLTETNILLGYASTESTEDAISQLGGRPRWIDPSNPPSAKLATCKVCNDFMTLLLQLSGDLPEQFPDHERRLYIFTCRRRTCRRKEGSIRAIRATRIAATFGRKVKPVDEHRAAEITTEAVKEDIGASIFGVQNSSTNIRSNTFASSQISPTNPFTKPQKNVNPSSALPHPSTLASMSPQKPFEDDLSETFAKKAAVSSPREDMGTQPPLESIAPWPSEEELPKAFPRYYLDAEYETLEALQSPETKMPSVEVDESGADAGGTEDKDVYESTIDNTFQKFADRLANNPEQVLRYEFKGKPLLYSKEDKIGNIFEPSVSGRLNRITTEGTKNAIPRCQSCGAARFFEVQLTPHAITELEVAEEGVEGMDWGTIILGVCGDDCTPASIKPGKLGYLEEWIGVQWEELGAKG